MNQQSPPDDLNSQPVPPPAPERRYFDPSHPAEPSYPREPPAPHKRKLNIGFFVLGFITPIAAGVLISGIGTAVSSIAQPSEAFQPLMALPAILLPVLNGALLIAFIVAMVFGGQRGDDRLRSYGIGGIAAYIVGALLLALVFGTCLIGLSQF